MVRKGTIFSGTGSDETAEKFLREDKESSFTNGIQTKEPDGTDVWYVFPDHVATDVYMSMILNHNIKTFGMGLEAFAKELKTIGKKSLTPEGLKELEPFVEEVRQKEKFEVDEDNLQKLIAYEINNTVLHEVCLHEEGGLSHYRFPSSIRFEGTVEKNYTMQLLEKYGLVEKCSAIYMDGNDKVRMLRFVVPDTTDMVDTDDTRETAGRIKALYKELRSTLPNTKIGYARQEFPIEFGPDNIELTDQEPYSFKMKSDKKN